MHWRFGNSNRLRSTNRYLLGLNNFHLLHRHFSTSYISLTQISVLFKYSPIVILVCVPYRFNWQLAGEFSSAKYASYYHVSVADSGEAGERPSYRPDASKTYESFASKCVIFASNFQEIFWRGGYATSPDSTLYPFAPLLPVSGSATVMYWSESSSRM